MGLQPATPPGSSVVQCNFQIRCWQFAQTVFRTDQQDRLAIELFSQPKKPSSSGLASRYKSQ